jgi:hypothetical protein
MQIRNRFFTWNCIRIPDSCSSSKWCQSATPDLKTLRRPFEPLRIHCERPRPSMAPFGASTAPEIWLWCKSLRVFTLIRILIPFFNSKADPDPASQNNRCGSGSATLPGPITNTSVLTGFVSKPCTAFVQIHVRVPVIVRHLLKCRWPRNCKHTVLSVPDKRFFNIIHIKDVPRLLTSFKWQMYCIGAGVPYNTGTQARHPCCGCELAAAHW